MKLNLKATGIELTEAIRQYVEKKFQTLEKHTDRKNAQIQVEVGRESTHHKHGEVFRAEAHMTHDGTDYYAAREASDLFAAIDLVRDEIIHELNKGKGRERKLLRRGQQAVKNILKGLPWFNK